MGVSVREIHTEVEYQAIARLRYDVYVEEMGKHPSGANYSNRTLTDELDAISVVLGAFDGDTVLATGRITPVHRLPPDHLWRRFYETHLFPAPDEQQVIYGKLMVRPEFRGTMVIPQILISAYERFRGDGAEIGFLHCSPSLVPLYEVVGCRRYKKGAYDPEAGFRLPMVQLLGDIEHFSKVKSPILRSVSKFPPNAELAEWFATRFPHYSHPASVRMMSEDDFLKTLSAHLNHESSQLLEGLSPEDVRQLIKSSAVVEAAEEDVILRKGDVGTEMYLILEGAVEISTSDALNNIRVLTTLGTGQAFGEGGFLLQQPRSADATSISQTKLLSISAENFRKISKAKPELAAQFLLNLSRVLCQRLYAAN